ncbi:hypothetical protein K3495_g14095, partial [Podosphaera aphanis]
MSSLRTVAGNRAQQPKLALAASIPTGTKTGTIPEQNGVSEAANKVILRLARLMSIDARMPATYWPWAVDHACFIANRLYCLRTKQILLTDFMQGLHQPHTGQVGLRYTHRFGCRPIKLITPKPGKFEPRATKGWFIGFQKNTSKNFIVYHPHYASTQGWKWIESFTPHASFNEDVMFGDELPSTIQQHTHSYWANNNSLFSETNINTQRSRNTSTHDFQTPEPFEGENLPSTPAVDPVIADDPPTPAESEEQSSQTYSRSPSPASCDNEQSSPAESHHTDQTSQSPSPPSTPYCHSQELILQPENQGESSAEEDLEEITYDQVMTGWDPIRPIAGQKRAHSPERDHSSEEDLEETPYDQVMTGWDPLRSVAGQKRPHSPDREYSPPKETMTTRRGRQVVKHDYKRLHYGKSAQISPDPKTWNEAMTCSEATQWKKAADEEFRSLKDKGAIKIIQRTQLPQGRKPMK